MATRVAALLLPLALPACSSGWDKSGTTAGDFARDDVACYETAAEASGPAPSDADRWGWAYVAYATDTDRAHDRCLAGKGWTDLRFPHWAGLYFPWR